MMFGLPRVITSDQGSEFNNALDLRLMEMLGVEHRLTTPYHPQVSVEVLFHLLIVSNSLWNTIFTRQMV